MIFKFEKFEYENMRGELKSDTKETEQISLQRNKTYFLNLAFSQG